MMRKMQFIILFFELHGLKWPKSSWTLHATSAYVVSGMNRLDKASKSFSCVIWVVQSKQYL